jgi:hypothetical protein
MDPASHDLFADSALSKEQNGNIYMRDLLN